MSRWLLAWVAAALVGAGCAASREAERAQGVRLQELQGTVEDLRQRITFEAGEKDALAGKLRKAQEELASCRTDAASERSRAGDLDRRLHRCEEAEAGLRADQDLDRRAREAAEQERDAARRQTQVAAEEKAAQLAALRKETEDCRGRLADAESQGSLLAAEKRKGELVARERVEEVTCNYDRLLQEARTAADALRQRISELEGSLEAETAKVVDQGALLEAREAAHRTAEGERARRQEEIARLRAALAAVPGEGAGPSGWSLVPEEGRAAVTVPVAALFAERSTELRTGARDALKRVAALAQREGLRVAIDVQAARVPSELAKKFPTPWDLAAAYAAKVARFLEKEGGVPAEHLTAGVVRLTAAPSVTVALHPPEASTPPAPTTESTKPAESTKPVEPADPGAAPPAAP